MSNIHTRWFLPLSFFLFISYIIFLADTADLNYGLEIVRIIPYGDKVMHALLYGIMAMLLNYGLNYRRVRLPTHLLTHHILRFGALANAPYRFQPQLGGLLVLLFAVLEEFSQHFIATRTFDIGDLVADLFGIVLFSFLSLKVIKVKS